MNVVLVYRGRYHIREALDLETLASALRAVGHRVALVYAPDTFGVTDNVLQISFLAKALNDDERTVGRILEFEPDMVAFSVLSSTYAWCCRIAKSVKETRPVPIVFLGLHPSLVPEHVMEKESVDHVIAGEAEEVLIALLNTLGGDGNVDHVGNLWYRHKGQVKFTHRAELVDLDALPLPDKELFHPYISHRSSYCAMVSRGCPYRCSFCEETCSKQLYGGKYYRRKSVDTVMNELVEGKRRYRYREVIFKDSYLSGDRQWLRELMERYRKEIGVPFKCFCTIVGFDAETAELLKEGGCYSIEFGLQTWNERIRREVLDRRETNDQAFEAFKHCARVKLHYDVDHMFNLPGETEADHALGAECYGRLSYLNRIKVHFLVYYSTAGIVDHAVQAGDLPADARQRLAEGEESDFYNQATGDHSGKKTVSGYATLYKLQPLLPRRMVDWLVHRGHVHKLRFIPSLFVAILLGVNAIRSRDLRFAAYLWIYPRKVWHSLLRSPVRSRQEVEC